MSQYDAPPTSSPTSSDVAPQQRTVYPDYSGVEQSLADLHMQEESVAEILAVLERAAQQIIEGSPDWVDPTVFGGSRKGERMARHTLRAQARVRATLESTIHALAVHHDSLTGFRDGVRRVEEETSTQLAHVRGRTEDVTA